MRTEHPEWKRLLDLAEGCGSREPDISEHMAACPDCRERLEQARAFIRILGDARMEHVPEYLVQSTLERLGVVGAPAAEKSTVGAAEAGKDWIDSAVHSLRELLAELIADSRTPSPALRGTAVSEPVILRYGCKAYEITLSLLPRTGSRSRSIIGQVVPLDAEALEPGGWVELSGSSGHPRSGLSEFGEFRIDADDCGAGEILIRTGADLVRVPLPSEVS